MLGKEQIRTVQYMCVCVCNSFTLTPHRSDMQATATIYTSRNTCSCTTSKTNLEPRRGLSWPHGPHCLVCCPHGARLRKRCDASAKSRTASTVLAREAVPLSPDPPNKVVMLLNASLTFPRSSRRRSLSDGQSSRTCITLSRPP